jgi:hypothetical protein
MTTRENYVPVKSLRQTQDPGFKKAEGTAPFSVKSFAEICECEPPAKKLIWGEVITSDQLQAVMGQGGIGKSRWVFQLAVHQVLELPFAGTATGGGPLKWLFMGTENSIHRLKQEMIRIAAPLTPDQVKRLGERLFFQVADSVDEMFITVGDDRTVKRWDATIKQIKPDVVVVDPFGEAMAGDINADECVRATLRTLNSICRRHDPHMAIIIIHHARTGRQNIAQASGYDRGNYGLGSKALYSCCRSVINLAPGDAEDTSRIVMVCGKANDCRPFPTIGLVLNQDTMMYEVDPTFDEKVWRDDVEGKRSGAKVTTVAVAQAIGNQGGLRHTELLRRLMEACGCSDTAAKGRVKKALADGYVQVSGEKPKDHTYSLTPRASTYWVPRALGPSTTRSAGSPASGPRRRHDPKVQGEPLPEGFRNPLPPRGGGRGTPPFRGVPPYPPAIT